MIVQSENHMTSQLHTYYYSFLEKISTEAG